MRPLHPLVAGPLPLAIAHRGGAAWRTENALATFEDVVRLGYRWVETDVRTTADGVPVVLHDADLARTAGVAGRVRELTLAQVRTRAREGGQEVATLQEALEALPALRLNVDLKDAGGVRAVPEVVRRAGAVDRVVLTSFSHRRVEGVRRVLPQACTGLGVGGVARFLAYGATQLPRPGRGAAVLQVPWRVGGVALPRRVVDLAHREGLAVHVWTVDDRAEMAAALDLGVDGVMTDEPEVLRDELLARGLWEPAAGP